VHGAGQPQVGVVKGFPRGFAPFRL
jgi:hypothetical protein